MKDASDLLVLMKEQIDKHIADDEKLQQFLTWINEKSCSVETRYKPAAVRAFYLSLNLSLFLFLDVNLSLDLSLSRSLDLSRSLSPELQYKLQELKKQIPDISTENRENLKQWWQINGQAWTEQLRTVIIEHRNIEHDWQFNEDQRKVLQQYYDANQLLVDCLNSECYVSLLVRQEIENTLLLPIKGK